ncbi:Mur ligase family protein [Sporolituus thermophilus]|uniref:UDP-N-acetylmuramoylalanyl-D-glutamate--2,6-diaminopimelate ligase n=1 Tax=Sporolituus thermophilus DSM 23256 TaxID=1123285 RepID=A0A1G7IU56_9FIRM|nr:UDP-N-acetylmuramyl-tripeptide synthetase [Sporolituus thermophilus]SDF16084.1 UDP-N-acetylmuramoylalanyl-D-glutamate--2,6-diaminopimelate ligase [Sporolituus thermophilus DSM 23256]
MNYLLRLLDGAAGISCHSGEIKPGWVFVAIRGRVTDGNGYATEAVCRGAKAVVTDAPDRLPPLAVPVAVVPDARQALAALAAHFYNHPSRSLNIVGITGSNGKTTVAFMLEHIFRTAGHLPGLIGTVRVNVGKTSFPSRLTTPDAASLQRYLALMRDSGVTHAAMEVSAQGVEMSRVDHVAFSCGILTNICADHLDFHHTFAGYLAAKERFLTLLGTSPLVVNSDDEHCRRMAALAGGPVVTVSLARPADVTAQILHTTAYGSKFRLTWNKLPGCQDIPAGQITVSLPLPGRHNVANALLVGAAALLHGTAPGELAAAFCSFKGIERRLEIYRCGGFTVIDDTALNPGSIDAVFATITSFRYRRLVVVNAIRGGRGAAINALNAACLARWQYALPFELIVTASADQVGPADTVTSQERQAFLDSLSRAGAAFSFYVDLQTAIRSALQRLYDGDLLVLLGAQGMDAGRQVLQEQISTSAQPRPATDFAIGTRP